jgi:3-dehydroquinate dehydratase/shikimate dehydrogenase
MTSHGTHLSAHYLRSRMSRVCVAITGATPQEMLEKADSVVRENSFLEFRLDYLEKPLAAVPLIRDFLYERSEVTAVATCRRVAGGGKFKGSPAAELEVLTQAAAAGFHLIDLEIETAEAITVAQFAALRGAGAGMILSSHDFEGTKDLDKTFARLGKYSPDFFKIVSTAKTLSDNVEMKRFLERTSDNANVIGICMGEQGLISRVLGVRAGSVFTFAAATVGEETGPGQIAARTLIETYRIDQIDAATKVYGVAGNPIRHSLSPIMMNSAFRRETVNGVFLALETKKLSDLLKLVQDVPIQGLAVTMPLKQEILPYLAKTDPISEKIGACNTIVRSQDGRLFGFNTDVGGIVRPLERRLQLRGAKILVLGAGGAARAAVFGLTEKGAEVTILNRTPETAQKLARQAKAKTIKREQVAKTQFDVILNATPAGMTGQKLQTILNPEELNARIVFDTVYNPIDTPLVRMAREKGIAVITGVEMFVQQGARQFEIWTGKPAPEEEMLRVVLHALRRRAEQAPSAEQQPHLVKSVAVTAAAPDAAPKPPHVTKVAAALPSPGAQKAKPMPAPAQAKPAQAKSSVPAPVTKSVASVASKKTPGKAAAPPIRGKNTAKTLAKPNGNGKGKLPIPAKSAKPSGSGKVPKSLMAAPAKPKKSAVKR